MSDLSAETAKALGILPHWAGPGKPCLYRPAQFRGLLPTDRGTVVLAKGMALVNTAIAEAMCLRQSCIKLEAPPGRGVAKTRCWSFCTGFQTGNIKIATWVENMVLPKIPRNTSILKIQLDEMLFLTLQHVSSRVSGFPVSCCGMRSSLPCAILFHAWS